MDKKREKYLDIIKGIAILVVVDVHVPIPTIFKWMFFVIPLFWVVSGILLYGKTEEVSYKEFIIKQLKTIMWVYFTRSLLFIFRAIIGDNNEDIIVRIYETISLLGIGTLWFLPSLFLGELIIFPILKKFKEKNIIIIPILVLITYLLVYILRKYNIIGVTAYLQRNKIKNIIIVVMQSLLTASYIGLGYIMKYAINKTNCMRYSRKVYLMIGIILLILSYFFTSNMKDDFHYVNIEDPIKCFLSTVVGILAIFNIAYGIEHIKFLEYPLGWMGRNSLIIMTTHLETGLILEAYYIIQRLNIHNEMINGILILLLVMLEEIIIVDIYRNTKLKVLYKLPDIRRREKNEE